VRFEAETLERGGGSFTIEQVSRRQAVICDVDGTLCDVSSIRHYVAAAGDKDFDAFHRESRHCPPNEQALDFCRRHHAAGRVVVVVVVTARMDRRYGVTKAWLDQWIPVPFDGPIMRPDGLIHSDVEVKRRIHRYLGTITTSSRRATTTPRIVALWTELGIPVEIVPGWEQ
jgi:hypothetical protein